MKYTEESIKSLEWQEHIRLRPGMYIGKLGDGSSPDDGIYVLVKEIFDNSVDEFMMGGGKTIKIQVSDQQVTIRDYGRGIPLGKVVDCVARMNTGGKYDSKAFQKSVGLNGVGTKAVNALSDFFKVQSIRDGKIKTAEFRQGNIVVDREIEPTKERNGVIVTFLPDRRIFKKFHFVPEYLENLIRNYVYLNAGLVILFNNKRFYSKNGLLDLLSRKTGSEELCYPIIHLKGEDIEVAFSHGKHYGEEYYSFVNGQFTTQGGTHLTAFKESMARTIRDFYKKSFDLSDIRSSVVAAVSLRVQEPIFESQTKTKLGSSLMETGGVTVRSFINDFLKRELDDYLHKHPDTTNALLKRILQSEKERKEIAGIKKLANKRAKKANLHNKKLRDCRVHYSDEKNELRYDSTIFITEGDSAGGSITKARDVKTQAVFSLRGKPLNCFDMSKKVVYQNEEFNLLHHALNIEEGLDNLRYNRVVIATDADVDGMHIRLLLLTFFLQFFPDMARQGHLYILETPLFRVRNKKKTFYCYNEKEKRQAREKLTRGDSRRSVEITRFKGLGEISPDEFGAFIGEEMRLEPVILDEKSSIDTILSYYMGKNTPARQEFIIKHLKKDSENGF
ncbi:MAG: DNA topoisomerase IV [Candidatus Cloacimonetes bacterium 4572_55]|nr:MAG: DNA topoisomerase IV [Candidatus Cloacimonetes bacterium 4572_55]